jgi:hypothetical protein
VKRIKEYLSAIKQLENAFLQWLNKQISSLVSLYVSQQEQRLKELAKKPHTSLTTAASPVSTSTGGLMTTPAIDIFSTPSSSNRYREILRLPLDIWVQDC